MKKIITLLGLLLVTSCLFAKGFKASDLMRDKKVIELIESYELESVYSDERQDLFRNEDTGDWVYIFQIGNESNNDKWVLIQIFVYIDGVFESCQRNGSYTGESTAKYMWACITETDTIVQSTNQAATSGYVWKDPKGVFVNCFDVRLQVFREMVKLAKTQEFEIPEAV